MNQFEGYYRRHLPHYQQPGNPLFVTFRLYGTLPKKLVYQLEAQKETDLKKIAGFENIEKKSEEYRKIQRKYFGVFEETLNKAIYGPKWLLNDGAAQIVNDSIHFYDGKLYNLICFTLMSNHVHLVFIPFPPQSTDSFVSNTLPEILQKLKIYTALKCNRYLHLTGHFWESESYDHVVRNQDELLRIVKYVLNNPVKAGLANKPEDWKWNYYNTEYL